MKQLNLSLLLATSTLCLLAVACGGDDDNDGTKASSNSVAGPNSGLASERLMSSLSDAEIEQLNTAIAKYADEQMTAQITTQQICDASGVSLSMFAMFGETPPTSDAELRQACSSISQTCTQDPSQTRSETTTEEDTFTKAELTDCSATVAEYQACMKDTTAEAIAMVKSFPKCAELTLNSVSTTMTSTAASESPASCKTLAQKCPAYAEAGDDSVTSWDDSDTLGD